MNISTAIIICAAWAYASVSRFSASDLGIKTARKHAWILTILAILIDLGLKFGPELL